MDKLDSADRLEHISVELTQIWKLALDLREVRPEQSFFALGGDSLDAMHILTQIEQRFGVELPNSAVFEHPTIAGLARAIDERLTAKTANPSSLRRAA